MSEIITRIPPSPTGHLHIGTARTALFNYLFTKKHGGSFIYRSEDTDTARSTKEYEKEIIEGLEWLGMKSDTIYRQSERGDIYRSYLENIIDSGAAYISKEESKQEEGKMVEVVRLKNPNKKISFEDSIRGTIEFDTTELGDFVIARSIDDALYHFAVVVDDYEMKVSHVIRGEDHISNTPRQILIQEAIGAPRPIYAHLPLILASDRSKMSKRHGPTSIFEYKEAGFLPEAIINYLALLGWNDGSDKEIFSLEELIEAFDMDGVQKSGAIFDIEKMKWINKEHLNLKDDSAFFAYVEEALATHCGKETIMRLIPLLRERVETKGDLQTDIESGEYEFAYTTPLVEKGMLFWKNDPSEENTLKRLQKISELLSSHKDAVFQNSDEIKDIIWDYAEEEGKGEVLWPLRVALTGKKQSPDPFSIIFVIGIEETLTRIESACGTISS